MGTTGKVTVLVFFTVTRTKISVKSGPINRKILSWPPLIMLFTKFTPLFKSYFPNLNDNPPPNPNCHIVEYSFKYTGPQ